MRWALVSHVCMLICLVGLWHAADLGTVFLIGVVAVTLLLAYEHWLVRPDNLMRVNLAFFHVNAVISVGLLVIAWLDVWISSRGG